MMHPILPWEGFFPLLLIQLICGFLFAVGSLFIFIELRSRFDRSFLYFGLSLIGLCAMVAVDIWVAPNATSLQDLLYCVRIQHVFACFYISCLTVYLMILTKSFRLGFFRATVFLSLIEIIVLMFNSTLKIENGKVITGPLYATLFAPYFIFYIVATNYIIFKSLRKANIDEKKILIFHLAGLTTLGLAAVIDLVRNMNLTKMSIFSATTFGALGYGIMASWIFTERFLDILREREKNRKKIESAYADLQQANTLKQLGESSAIINHEIKNYMFMISGNAQLIQEMELVTGKGKELLGHIITSVERLQKFSMDILELSRTHILQDKQSLNLSELIRDVIYKNFRNRIEAFSFKGLEQEHIVPGDWGKLQQVFVNIFSNAFDAAHPDEKLEIKIRISNSQSAILLTVEDNGVGCNEEQIKKMFTAFYTTKRGQKGTGLGLSISRTIIESHGGHISMYSKNLSEENQHGVKFQITFPNFAEETAKELDRKSPILIIKEGLPNIAGIIRVFQNVYVTPYFVQTPDELMQKNFKRNSIAVLASADTAKEHYLKFKEFERVCILAEYKGSLLVQDYKLGKTPVTFSEEYILNHLSKNVPIHLVDKKEIVAVA